MRHLRKIYKSGLTGGQPIPYPACLFSQDSVQGVTTENKLEVNCPVCLTFREMA